jgi:hypothetical protein
MMAAGIVFYGISDDDTVRCRHLRRRCSVFAQTPICKVNEASKTNQEETAMRAHLAYPAILIAFMLGSTPIATAQTGEFASQVPGAVVHAGWELQDQLQNARSGMPARSVSRTTRDYDTSNSAKPAADGVATANGTKGKR